MKTIFDTLRSWIADLVAGWNRFWFSPADPVPTSGELPSVPSGGATSSCSTGPLGVVDDG